LIEKGFFQTWSLREKFGSTFGTSEIKIISVILNSIKAGIGLGEKKKARIRY